MEFELGKCYQHSSGFQYHICGKANSILYGEIFIAENGRDKNVFSTSGKNDIPDTVWNQQFVPVGIGEGYAENWYEISYEKFFLDNFQPCSKMEERMLKRKLKLNRLLML